MPLFVFPAKAGIQIFRGFLDPRFRGEDNLQDFLEAPFSPSYSWDSKFIILVSFIIPSPLEGEGARRAGEGEAVGTLITRWLCSPQ